MTVVRKFAFTGMLLGAVLPAIGQAQAPPRSADNPCFNARPQPACSAFFLTTAGAYIGHSTRGDTPFRGTVDWGVMVNTSPRNAFGGSWFVNLDEDDFSTGPVARYRRWFEKGRSLDLGVGTPVAAGQNLKPGSILGSVKYNPVHWFGVVVRPELARHETTECVDVNCTTFSTHTSSSGRLYGGVEFGSGPGLALSIGGGIALGLLVIAYAASGSN